MDEKINGLIPIKVQNVQIPAIIVIQGEMTLSTCDQLPFGIARHRRAYLHLHIIKIHQLDEQHCPAHPE